MSEIEVIILDGSGECPRFQVTWHIFGRIPEGEKHNDAVIERMRFIEDAINEKLRAAQKPQGGQK